MSELPAEYGTFAFLINEGDKVRFERSQCTVSFLRDPEKPITAVEGVVLMQTTAKDVPGEVCLSLPGGNFWFDTTAQVTYIGQATPEELDYEYTATYGEGHPDHA